MSICKVILVDSCNIVFVPGIGSQVLLPEKLFFGVNGHDDDFATDEAIHYLRRVE